MLGFDAISARALTSLDVPVVEIVIAANDYLRPRSTIKKAAGASEVIAALGSSSRVIKD